MVNLACTMDCLSTLTYNSQMRQTFHSLLLLERNLLPEIGSRGTTLADRLKGDSSDSVLDQNSDSGLLCAGTARVT